ncbi:uncharacterized protein LOC142981269 [Anticarsia gemmatalis]|uniref:uncharacterized protein LOC142981269 n=1 Tax=Anticarsia gemmatalis TaxID=129554 RepID=UPI003F763907
MGFKEIFIFLVLVAAINAEYISYDKYKVYKVVPETEDEVKILIDLKNYNNYTFWSEGVRVDGDVRIMVAPEKQTAFEKYFKDVGITTKVLIQDVQEQINSQLRRPTTRTSTYAWDYYQNLEEINAWLQKIALDYPNIVSLVRIGYSVEGRPIWGVKIDYKKQENPVIGMLEGGVHAREWISPATVTYIINEFLTSTDPAVRFVAENIVWHVFPMMNPDGYAYTFTTNRMWRKNRNPTHFTNCSEWGVPDDISNGIDLNRNFGFLWMTIGSSLNPCFETFAGPTEFSEPESRAIRDYVFKLQTEGRLIYYFAFHSYSQMIMIPFSHLGGADVLENPNYGDMYEIAIRGAAKLTEVHGTEYLVGTSKDILYPASGSSDDWVRGGADVPIVALYELRDLGEYGFLLPPEQIIPNNEEVMASLIEMEKVTRGLGYYHSSGEKILCSVVLMMLALVINYNETKCHFCPEPNWRAYEMGFKEIFYLIAFATVINAEYVSYENFKVYKTVPVSDNEVQILTDLRKQNEYMFWSDIISLNGDVRIMVAPEKQNAFEKYVESVGITTRVVIENVQEEINNQLRRPATRSTNYAWDYYLSLDEINAWLEKIASENPNVVTLVNIGTSVEGRFIRGVKIDFKKQADPVIGMIEGGIHSREWISPATVTYIINEFLTSTDPNVRAVAENIVWHIFPVVNPDGYAYTFSNNRMWRKNRNTTNFTPCGAWGVSDDISNGIDLNRNFGFLWMTVGASNNPCAETFAGPSAFSEPESRAIRDYVTRIQREGRMIFYFAFHSYSQMVLVPYSHVGGYDVLEASNYADMYEIAIRGMDKLKAKHGTDYVVGTSKDILYEVSGSSFDWVRGVADVPIVYLFELRDVGEYGFLLPPEQIIPNNQEIMASLIEMEKVTRSLGYYQYNSGAKILYSFVMLMLGLFVTL